MLNAADNELLTRTGPGTPMGELFRRYWIPALLSAELPERDGAPKRVRLLGEDLVAFRDTEGRVGLSVPNCPHRGANLFFGRNEGGGIRCAFHGWKFDVDGKCLEAPSAGENPGFCSKIKLKTYPTVEWGDFIWAYMGPPEHKPPLPSMEFGMVPTARRFVSKKLQECNWAQACEGGLDTAHFTFLHMTVPEAEDGAMMKLFKKAGTGTQGFDVARWIRDDGAPKFATHNHPAGITIGGARRADGDNLYWRITQFLLPNHALAPNAFPGEDYHGQTWVPIDDTSCWIYCYSWNPERDIPQQDRDKFKAGYSVHAEVDENWVPLRNRGNDYLIDRQLQKTTTYTGITGVSEQDAAIQDSQGLIADRTQEHLTPTDVGVVQFRRLMLGAAKKLRDEGTLPPGSTEPLNYLVRGGAAVAPAARSIGDVLNERFGHSVGHVGHLYK